MMYECVVCGRKFPEGQGVIMTIAGKKLYFHSKRCAYRFLRSLIDKVDSSALGRALNETLKEFEELKKRRAELTKKKI